MRRRGLLGLLVALVAAAPAAARAAVVPRLSGDVNRAYAVLHREGFRVSIARPFTLRSDAATVVRHVSPKPGSRLRHGSVVTLRVSCCRVLRPPPPLGSGPGAFVPAMRGSRMTDVQAWAETAGRRYSARLAPLFAAGGATLLGNYIVARQSLPPNAGLVGAAVLKLAAVPGTPPPCTLPYYTYVIARDSQAVLYSTALNPPYALQDDACVIASGHVERLGVNDQANGVYDYPEILVGLRVAGLHTTGPDKYDPTTPSHAWVVTWDLSTGERTVVYDAGASFVPQLVMTPEGFTAWTVAPMSPTSACGRNDCPVTAIFAHDSSGLRTLASVDPSAGDQLGALTLDGDVVNWTHDGAAESATLH